MRSIAFVAFPTAQLYCRSVSSKLNSKTCGSRTDKLTNAAFFGGRKLICSISVWQQNKVISSKAKLHCIVIGLASEFAKVLPQLVLVEFFKIVDRPDIHVPGSTGSDVGHHGRAEIADGPTPTDLDLSVVNQQAVTSRLLEKAGSRVGVRESHELTKTRSAMLFGLLNQAASDSRRNAFPSSNEAERQVRRG